MPKVLIYPEPEYPTKSNFSPYRIYPTIIAGINGENTREYFKFDKFLFLKILYKKIQITPPKQTTPNALVIIRRPIKKPVEIAKNMNILSNFLYVKVFITKKQETKNNT